MWRWLCLAVLVAGCEFEHGTSTSDDAPPPDSGGCITVPELAVTVCLEAPATGTLMVSSPAVVDTSAGATTSGMFACRSLLSGSSDVCVIAAQTMVIDDVLSATGNRPLVLVADTLTLAGTIDVASHRGGSTGAGADAPGCDGGVNPTGGGGGQGGAFALVGGNGGDQDPTTTTHGTSGAIIAVDRLRGGCSGSNGGGSPATAGAGGGALLVISPTIVVRDAGVINASGASGVGAVAGHHGGGGGGSGGMLAFKTSSFAVMGNAQIFANGGGGAAGSGAALVGASGTEATSAAGPTTGGGGYNTAGDGGYGYPQTPARGGSGIGNADGGGGGGGGGGVVRVLGTTISNTANISPPPA